MTLQVIQAFSALFIVSVFGIALLIHFNIEDKRRQRDEATAQNH